MDDNAMCYCFVCNTHVYKYDALGHEGKYICIECDVALNKLLIAVNNKELV